MNFHIGDVVRVGKGKVEYTVTWTPESVGMASELADPEIQSHNTGNLSRVAASRLVLVQDVMLVAEDADLAEQALQIEQEETSNALIDSGEGFPEEVQLNPAPVDTDDENEDEAPVVETSAYAKAVLFALNKLQKHVYAGTVSKTKKAKTRRLNLRQKASRKANR